MIVFRERRDIDLQRWNDCVANSADTTVFGMSWYLDAVAENWGGLIMGDYEAVMPVPYKSKLGIRIVYQPFFTRYFSVHGDEPVDVSLFLEALPSSMRYVQLGLHERTTNVPAKFESSPRVFQQLDLHHNAEVLSSAFSENTRRSIRKAEKMGWKETRDVSPREIVGLFRSTKGQELEVFGDADFEKLLRLMDNALENNSGLSIGLRDERGKIVAAAFFIYHAGRYTYLKSGATAEGRKNGAMHLLMSRFIAGHAGTATVLDFGGSSVDSVARFYKSFGGKDCVYLHIKLDRLPTIVRWLKKIKS